MHHIYTTEAFIIKSMTAGEANRSYFLFTKDLGLVRATAQSVRLNKSKLNGHLQGFSLVRISLVKGRDFWRIVSVETILQNGLSKDLDKLSVLFNVFGLLLRLIHGEEKNENLFESIKSTYVFCRDFNLSLDELKTLETLAVLRVMHFLGYIKKGEGLSVFSEDTNVTQQIILDFAKKRKTSILEINQALKETHL